MANRAFSLVEVALALGLIAFCLVAIIGLLPVGLDSVRQASRQAEAVRLLKHLATGIQGAARDEAGLYRLAGFDSLGSVTWRADGGSIPPREGHLAASGAEKDPAEADFSYRLRLTAPDTNDPASIGRASISLAWPAGARWDGEGWSKAQGSEEILVMFRVR